MEADQIHSYQFLDVVAWLHDFKPDRVFYDDFLKSHGLDANKKTIVVREEEFKASYVHKKNTLCSMTVLRSFTRLWMLISLSSQV